MILGLGGSTIWSSDINNLLPFYRDVVGLKPGIETPEFVVFGDNSAPGMALGTHSEVRGRASDPYRHMVGLTSDDIHADVGRLKAAGVEWSSSTSRTTRAAVSGSRPSRTRRATSSSSTSSRRDSLSPIPQRPTP